MENNSLDKKIFGALSVRSIVRFAIAVVTFARLREWRRSAAIRRDAGWCRLTRNPRLRQQDL